MSQISSYLISLARRLRSFDETAAREFASIFAPLLSEVFVRNGANEGIEEKVSRAIFDLVAAMGNGEVRDAGSFGATLAAIVGRYHPKPTSMQSMARNAEKLMGVRNRTLAGFRVQIGYWPLHEVGGDFYDTLELSDGRSLIAIGDAVGKGPAASVYSLFILSALRATAIYASSGAEIMNRLNAAMLPAGDSDSVAMSLIEIDAGKKIANILNAGMPRPLHLAKLGGHTEIQVAGHPLGWFQSSTFDAIEIHLAPADRLLFWSDGIADSESLRNSVMLAIATHGTLPSVIGLPENGEEAEPDDRTAILVDLL